MDQFIVMVPCEVPESVFRVIMIFKISLDSNLFDDKIIVQSLNKKYKFFLKYDQNSENQTFYGKGSHNGLIIMKNYKLCEDLEASLPDVCFKFNVYLASRDEGFKFQFAKENRVLKFWYKCTYAHLKDTIFETTNKFLGELFTPNRFPRDYVGFVTRIMKLMQKYDQIDTMQLQFRTCPEAISYEKPQAQPSRSQLDDTLMREVLRERILVITESIYPSSIFLDNLIRHVSLSFPENTLPNSSTPNPVFKPSQISEVLQILSEARKVRQLNDGSWVRVNEFTRVKSISSSENENSAFATQTPLPFIDCNNNDRFESGYAPRNHQFSPSKSDSIERNNNFSAAKGEPVIAVITSLFCEKLAVDSMLENAYTFVKYKSQGSHHLYTIGNIGLHKVVSIKLSMLGKSRHAMISASNAITRLLGTFPSIKYIFLVGVGSAINRFHDYRKKFRFGDVVASSTNPGCDYTYIRCEPSACNKTTEALLPYLLASKNSPKGSLEDTKLVNSTKITSQMEDLFEIKTWKPRSKSLINLVHDIVCESLKNENYHPWTDYAEEGLIRLQKQTDYNFAKPLDVKSQIPITIGNDDFLYLDESFEDKLCQTEAPSKSIINSIHLGAIGSFSTRITPNAENHLKNTIDQLDMNGHQSVCADSGSQTILNHNHLEACIGQEILDVLAPKLGILAFDHDFDLILDAVQGNCIENYIILRGVADYARNMAEEAYAEHCFLSSRIRNKHCISSNNNNKVTDNAVIWAPHAALNAAAFMKTMILELDV